LIRASSDTRVPKPKEEVSDSSGAWVANPSLSSNKAAGQDATFQFVCASRMAERQ